MSRFFKEIPLHIIFGSGLALLSVAFVLAVQKLDIHSQFLILHFDVYRGIDMFGGIGVLYRVLALGFITILVNFFLASTVFNRERFFAYMLACASLFFAVLLLIGVSVIIIVN